MGGEEPRRGRRRRQQRRDHPLLESDRKRHRGLQADAGRQRLGSRHLHERSRGVDARQGRRRPRLHHQQPSGPRNSRRRSSPGLELVSELQARHGCDGQHRAPGADRRQGQSQDDQKLFPNSIRFSRNKRGVDVLLISNSTFLFVLHRGETKIKNRKEFEKRNVLSNSGFHISVTIFPRFCCWISSYCIGVNVRREKKECARCGGV
ncbi:uncharacterized protein LOC124404395 isoform X2 [Diprion similis]|uniref:uncharacterized protein LOC124404395 isoform X2 n=1 Tax=Diprion similis TaxID=362088 RepID=UPI001EF75A26|nr:uncharacterized protein LOC124404395 isoform X2 [Diprion similis]